MARQLAPLPASDLQRSVDACRELLEQFDAEVGSVAETRVASSVLVALAALETVLRTASGDSRREPSLLIAVTLGREAAAAVRRRSHDERLLRCAEECERGVELCQAELDARPR